MSEDILTDSVRAISHGVGIARVCGIWAPVVQNTKCSVQGWHPLMRSLAQE